MCLSGITPDKYFATLKKSLTLPFLFIFLPYLGHQALINDVKFSPDGRIIASGSFDKSVKLWDGKTGK